MFIKSFLCSVALLAVTIARPQTSSIRLQTRHAVITVSNQGYVTSIKAKATGREYNPAGLSSPLLTLDMNHSLIRPVKAVYSASTHRLLLSYPNGAVATIRAEEKPSYLRMQLTSLTGAPGIDNVIWGPYKTNISKTIGDIIGVVRDDSFAIGLLGLNDNTTSGPPTDGDMSFMYYYIHSPDPVKYPLPPGLKEGQTFAIGGDGVNDVAFYSHPEEYYRMNVGDGARLEPAYGSSICMHSRDRRKEQMIRFPNYPAGINAGLNSSRYQLVVPTDADLMGSAVAFYACPDNLGLRTIESVVLQEGLPHPTIDGRWVKDPNGYRPDIAWYGPHDSVASYAAQLGLTSVQDEGLGEYYPNPANRWGRNRVDFAGGKTMTIPDFGASMRRQGIRWGLHTLCEFLQAGANSDVTPVPSDSLGIMMRTRLAQPLGVNDTVIVVEDTVHFNEFGGWEGNHTNVLKIGKELIEYNGITTTPPYTFLHVKRGFHHTSIGEYPSGTTIVKLQPNCYAGFVPDMRLQDFYGDYYGRLFADGGMDFVDFDGLESCMYQGQGHYSFKRFFRSLFDSYAKHGGKYLRVMGSAMFEGNWHYMSVCNIGGDDHMFNTVTNQWGIEGKDARYSFQSSYLPATFGIVGLTSSWSLSDLENLQAKSIGWDANYMLGLSEEEVENMPDKSEFFAAYKTWENARATGVFTAKWKTRLADLRYKYHLVQRGPRSFFLYPVYENRWSIRKDSGVVSANNPFSAQLLDLSVRIHCPKDQPVDGLSIRVGGGKPWTVNRKLQDGQFIIAKNGELYLADAHRRKIERLASIGAVTVPAGQSQLVVDMKGDNGEKATLETVVALIGRGEPIK